MGTEFLNTTRKTAKKHLDRRKAELCEPDLFTPPIKDLGRSFLAKTEHSRQVTEGQRILVEADGAGCILLQGRSIVGRSEKCQPTLAKRLEKAGGVFPAIISSVNPISSTLEFCIAPLAAKGN